MKTFAIFYMIVMLLTAYAAVAAPLPYFTPNRFKNTEIAGGIGSQYLHASIPAPLYGSYTAGTFVAYRDDADNSYGTLKVMRIKGEGSSYTPVTINAATTASLSQPRIVVSGAYSIVCWERGGTIYMSRCDALGNPYLGNSWAAYPDGKPIITTSYAKYELDMVSDGGNGAIICWREKRGSYYQIFVQRVDVSGNIKWAANGRLVVNNLSYSVYAPKIIISGTNTAIVAWYDSHGLTGYDVYAQRVSGVDDASFSLMWGSGGIGVSTPMIGDQYQYNLCSDDSSGAFFGFLSDGGATGQDIYLQRVNLNGVPRVSSGGIVACNASGNQDVPDMAAFTGSTYGKHVVMAWSDFRNEAITNRDIYAVRAYCSGTIGLYTSSLWNNTAGVQVCIAEGAQYQARVTLDSLAVDPGVLISWADGRSGTYDLYAARYSFNGSKLSGWTTANGTVISEAPGSQPYSSGHTYRVWRDDNNNGDFVYLWTEYSSGYDLHMQKENEFANYIDRVAPSAPNLTNRSNTNTKTPLLSWNIVSGAFKYYIELSASSSFATLAVSDSVGPNQYTVPAGKLSNGTWYWRVKARDDGDNFSGFSVGNAFTIDTIAPYWHSFSIRNGDTVATSRPVLSAIMSDNGVIGIDSHSIVMKVDGNIVPHTQAWPMYPQMAQYTPVSNLSKAWHRVTWYVHDSVGNGGSSDTASVNFLVDLTLDDRSPPVFSNLSPAESSTVNTLRPPVSISVGDPSGINAASMSFEVNRDIMTAVYWNGIISWTPGYDLPQGPNEIQVVISDMSINANQGVLHYHFFIDNIPPQAPTYIGPSILNTNSLDIKAGMVEDKAVVKLYRGAAFLAQNSSGYFQGITLTEGQNTLRLLQIDSAGNVSPYTDINVTVDATAPDAPAILVLELPSYTGSNSVLVRGIAEHNAYLTLYINGNQAGFQNMLAHDTFGVVVGLDLGANQITARQVDSVGNSGPHSAPVTVTVDMTAPVTDSVSPRHLDTLINSTPTLWAALHDIGGAGLNVDSLQFNLNGQIVAGNWDGLSKYAHTVSMDLTDKTWNYFKVRAVDQAGNVFPGDSIAFYLDKSSSDKIPPVISAWSPTTSQTTPMPLIYARAQDFENGLDESSVRLFVDGVQKTPTYNTALNEITFTPGTALTQGTHSCSLYVADASTNHNSATSVWSFFLDSDAPSAPQVNALPTPTNIASVKVAGATGEPRVFVQVYNNGVAVASGYSDASGAFSISPVSLINGANSILTLASDSLGNTSAYSSPVNVFLDDVKPAIVSMDPAEGQIVGVRTPLFTVRVSDGIGSGISPESVYLNINAGVIPSGAVSYSNNVFSYQYPANPFTHGNTVAYSVAVRDKAGNISDTASAVFTVDTTLADNTPPVFSSPAPAPNSTVNKGFAEIRVNVADVSGVNPDSIRVFADASLLTPEFNGSEIKVKPTALLSEGRHSIRVMAMDKSLLRNRDSLAWAFFVDTRAPVRPQLDQASTPTNSQQITLTGKSERAALVILMRGIDTLGTTRCDSLGSFQKSVKLVEGQNRFIACSVDTAGNAGAACPAMTVLLDSRAPEVSNVYPAGGFTVTSERPVVSALLTDTGSGVDSARSYLVVLDKQLDTVIGDSARRHVAVYNPLTGVMKWQSSAALTNQAQYLLYFQAYDRAGNLRSVNSAFFTRFSTLDNEPPQITAISPTGTVQSRTPEISAIITDNMRLDIAGTVLLVDQTPAAFSYDTLQHKLLYQSSVPMSENVEHKVELTAKDTARNGKSQQWSFYIDATPPAAPVLDTLPDFTKTLQTGVSGRAEARSSVDIIILGVKIGSATADDSGRFTATGVTLNEGVNILHAQATDAAGNKGDLSQPDTIFADIRPPVLLSSSPVSGTQVGSTPPLSAQIADTGKASGVNPTTVVILVDGKSLRTAYSNGTARADTAIRFTTGQHSFTVQAADLAGNGFTSAQIQFIVDSAYVDKVPPVFSGLSPANNARTGSAKPEISLVISDASSAVDSASVKLLIGLTPVTGFTFSKVTGRLAYTPALPFEQGLVNVMAIAQDAPQNKDTVEWKFQVDLTPPPRPSFVLKGDTLVQGVFVALSGLSETGAAVALFRDSILVSNLPALDSDTAQFIDVPVQKGTNRFHLIAYDEVGNASAPSETLNVVYNTAAPVIGNAGVGSVAAREDSSFTFQIIASDGDGNRLYYRFLKPANPESYGMTIDSNGLFSWNPALPYTDQAVQLRVDDGLGLSDTILFLATAAASNDRPVISGLRDTVITRADSVVLSFAITDEDDTDMTAIGIRNPADPSMRLVKIGGTTYQFVLFADSTFTDSVRLFAFDGEDSAFGAFRLSVTVQAASAPLTFPSQSDTLRIRLGFGPDTATLFFPYNNAVSGKNVVMQRLAPLAHDSIGGNIGIVGSLFELSGLDSGFSCKLLLPVPQGFTGDAHQLMIFRRANAASPWRALRVIETALLPGQLAAWLTGFSQYTLGLDTVAPILRIDSVNAGPVIYATLRENISNPEITLHYREAGQSALLKKQVVTTVNGTVLVTDAVPYSFVNASKNGFEFWLSATDGLHTVTTAHRSIGKTLVGAALPGSALASGDFRMVSLPYSAGKPSPDSVLGSVITGDTLAWRIGRWRATDIDKGAYEDHRSGEANSFLELKPGAAIWVYAKNAPGSAFPVSSATTTPLLTGDSLTQGFEVALIKGWNQIGNPYPFRIKASDVALDTSKVQNVFYAYSPSSRTYAAADTLEPYAGYWILARTAAAIVFPSLPPSAALGKVMADSLAWIAELSAGNCTPLRLGEFSLGREGRDAGLDIIGPPSIISGLRLAVPHADWPAWGSTAYMQDIQSACTQGNTWNVSAVRASALDKTAVYPLALGNGRMLPASENLVAYFPAEKVFVDLRSEIGADLVFAPGESSLTFKVVAGTGDYVASVTEGAKKMPDKTDLCKNAPNPFNPITRIRYQIKKPGQVSIVVYDLRGRVVTGLVNCFQRAGYFTTQWDGRTEQGCVAASGLYFYRMECGGFVKTNRMVFVK